MSKKVYFFIPFLLWLLPFLSNAATGLTLYTVSDFIDKTGQIDTVLLNFSQDLKLAQFGYYEQIKDLTNVYESPNCQGYQTIQKFDDRVEYVGYGCLAKDYTYTIPIPPFVASSTKDIISDISNIPTVTDIPLDL